MDDKMTEAPFDTGKCAKPGDSGNFDPQQLTHMAVDLVDLASDSGLSLRLAGGLACWCHSPEARALFSLRGAPYSDMDFAALLAEKDALIQLFASRGFLEDSRTATVPGSRRSLLKNAQGDHVVDISYNALEYNHTILLRDRIETDYPTLPPSDLLLQKLQIVRFTRKDWCDAIMLVIAHEVSENEGDFLNIGYLSRLCSKDWGLWRTVIGNLINLQSGLRVYSLPSSQESTALERIEALLRALRTSEKSVGWRVRSLIGDRITWYTCVDNM